MGRNFKLFIFFAALVVQLASSICTDAQTTANFSYTGSQQTWTVPNGVTSVTVDMAGGSGGGNGGGGGRVQATLTVTPGQTLYLYVGQQGGTSGAAAYNGGGKGGVYNSSYRGSGGGASDIRSGGTALSNRVLVAGGGGGGGTSWGSYTTGVPGGAGGGLTAGSSYAIFDNPVAGGGTQSGGGIYGWNSGQGSYGNAGSLGTGGDGGSGSSGAGGGGGGGYYGGGGGGLSSGGGGSSYSSSTLASSVTHTQGYNSGNGYIAITYSAPPPPVVSSQPTSTSVCLASNATLSAAFTGATSYQWYKNGTAIPSATSTSYSIAGAAYTDTGSYYIAATNTNGTTNSDTVKVSITAPTVITSNPVSTATICYNGSQSFSVGATGAGLSYQWAVNTGSGFTNISDNYFYSGSATGTLHISNAITAMNGYQYVAYVTGTCGTDTTTTSTLSVDSTEITSNAPLTNTICYGGSATIGVTASGPGLTYQWAVNTGSGFNNISNNFFYSGAATNTLHISNAITAMSGYQYRLTVSGTCGTLYSNTTTLTVDSVKVTANPSSSVEICHASSTTISGSATGNGLTYQWAVNTGSGYTNLSDNYFYSGTATNTLHLSNVIAAMSGYKYRLTVTGTCNTAYTTAATLTVDTTIITSDLSARSHICFGGNSTISAAASGPGLTYQWTVNTGSGFVNLSDNATYTGTQTNTLHIINSNFTFGGYQYQLNVTGTCGNASTIVTTAVIDSFPLPLTFNPNYNWALQGQVNVVYSTNLDTDVNYNWAYSGTGASIANSGDTARYTYSVTATAGNVSVFATSPYGCGTTSTISQGITVYQYDIWNGDSSKNWNDTNNWDRHIVPYGTISAYIPTILTPLVGIMDTPEIYTGNTNACYRLYMEGNSGLTIDASSKLIVNSNATLLASVQGAGILSFAGSSAQTITASDTVYNLEINNSHGVTLPQNSRLHIKYGFYPTSGTFTNNGTMFLISDSNGTATVNTGSSSGGYITGNDINVQKYIHGGRRAYRFLAHPFNSSIGISQLTSAFDITGNGGGANGFTTTGTNNPSAFWYNPVTANGSDTDDVTGWIPFTDMSGTGVNAWNQFEGLRVMVRGVPGQGLDGNPYTPLATTINMHGQLAQGDVTTSLISNSNKGYNFIANPYAASIDLSTLSLGSSVGPNFWVWDPNQGLAGAYVSQPLAASYILPAYSSFVVTTSASSNNTVTFHESSKTTATAANLFKTTDALGYDVVQLHIYSNNQTTSWDRLLIYFRGNASANVDGADAPKWANDDLNFYTYSADSHQLSIDVRPYNEGQTILLGLNTTQQQTYTMSVDDMDVSGTVQLYLHDKYLNKVQQIHKGDVYTFTVSTDPNSQGDNRFELNQTGQPSSVAQVSNGPLSVNIAPNPVTNAATLSYSAKTAGNTIVTVTNIIGQQMYSKNLGMQQKGFVVLPMSELASGVYLVTFQCGNEKIINRLVKN